MPKVVLKPISKLVERLYKWTATPSCIPLPQPGGERPSELEKGIPQTPTNPSNAAASHID